MSVHFNVRRVGSPLLAALRRDPSLTTSLCDSLLDFDAALYEAQFRAATKPQHLASSISSFEYKKNKMLALQEEAFIPLEAAGLTRKDLGTTLRLDRSWNGMEEMIAAPEGRLLISAEGGEEIGDDIGYGAARLLAPAELVRIAGVLARLTYDAAKPRYRAFEIARIEKLGCESGSVPTKCTDGEFDLRSWHPLCALRDFVHETGASDAWLLKWYD
jgi:hypothetical protein